MACNAYVVRLDARGLSHPAMGGGIAGSRYVRWLDPLQPASRISPAARGGRVLHDLFPGADVHAVAAGAGGTRGQVAMRFESSNGAGRPAGAAARPIASWP